ncbi:hypothetical protein FOLKNPGA_03416 [Legionella sp. PC1000]|nr:hypothetical protein FOLKNPGA_03416 [Legionella sp. PC1000]
MVRPLRIEFAGGLYHITSRGNRNVHLKHISERVFKNKFRSSSGM